MIDNAIVNISYDELMIALDRLLSKHGVDIRKAPPRAILGCLVHLKSIEDTEAWQVENLYAELLATRGKPTHYSKYIFQQDDTGVGRVERLIKKYINKTD